MFIQHNIYEEIPKLTERIQTGALFRSQHFETQDPIYPLLLSALNLPYPSFFLIMFVFHSKSIHKSIRLNKLKALSNSIYYSSQC